VDQTKAVGPPTLFLSMFNYNLNAFPHIKSPHLRNRLTNRANDEKTLVLAVASICRLNSGQ
jgi:hypothetical protein